MDFEGLQDDLYEMWERAYVSVLRDLTPCSGLLDFMNECNRFRLELARWNG